MANLLDLDALYSQPDPTSSAPPTPPSPSYVPEGIGAGMSQAASAAFGWIPKLWEAGGEVAHFADIGLGRLSTLAGSPMGQPSTQFAPGPQDVPFSQQLGAITPEIVRQIPGSQVLTPQGEEFAAAALQPPIEMAAQFASDPRMAIPFGALAKFGKAGKALATVVSAGFAGSMGKAGYDAAVQAKQIFDEEGITPNSVRKASEATSNLLMAGAAAAGGAREARGFFKPEAPPSAPTALKTRGGRAGLDAASKQLEQAAKIMKEVIDEGMARRTTGQAATATRTPQLAELPSGATVESVMRGEPTRLPGGEETAFQQPGVRAPKGKLIVINKENIGSFPEYIQKEAKKGPTAFSDIEGNIYLTPKSMKKVLEARTPEEALGNLNELLSHEYSHLFRGAQGKVGGEREPSKLFDVITGRRITPKPGQGVDFTGRSSTGHAAGEYGQDLPADVQIVARTEALRKMVSEHPRVQNLLQGIKERGAPEIQKALRGIRKGGVLEGTYSPQAAELARAAVGEEAGGLRPEERAYNRPGRGTPGFRAAGAEKREPIEVVREKKTRWNPVDFKERLGVYEQIREMGGPTPRNLEHLGITPEQFRQFQITNTATWHNQRNAGKINPDLQKIRDIAMGWRRKAGVPQRELGLNDRAQGISPRQAQGRAPQPGGEMYRIQQESTKALEAARAARKAKSPEAIRASEQKLGIVSKLIEKLRGIWSPGQEKAVGAVARGITKERAALTKAEQAAETQAARAQEAGFKEAVRRAKTAPELKAMQDRIDKLENIIKGLTEGKAPPKKARALREEKDFETEVFRPGEEGEFKAAGAEKRPRIKSEEEKALEKETGTSKSILARIREGKRGVKPKGIVQNAPALSKESQEGPWWKRKFGPVGAKGIREPLLPGEKGELAKGTIEAARLLGKKTTKGETERVAGGLFRRPTGARSEIPVPSTENLAAVRRLERIKQAKAKERFPGAQPTKVPEAPSEKRPEAKRVPEVEVRKKFQRPGILATRTIPHGGLGLELKRTAGEKELAARAAAGEKVKPTAYQPKKETYYSYERKGSEKPEFTRLVPEGPKRVYPKGKALPPKPLTIEKAEKILEEAPKFQSRLPQQLERMRLRKAPTAARRSRILTRARDILKTGAKNPYTKEPLTLAEAKTLAKKGLELGSQATLIGKRAYSLNDLVKMSKGVLTHEGTPSMKPRLAIEESGAVPEPGGNIIPSRNASQEVHGYTITKKGNVNAAEGKTISLEQIAKASPSKAHFSLNLDTFIEGLQKRGILSPGKATTEYRRRATNYFEKVKPTIERQPPQWYQKAREEAETPRQRAERVLGFKSAGAGKKRFPTRVWVKGGTKVTATTHAQETFLAREGFKPESGAPIPVRQPLSVYEKAGRAKFQPSERQQQINKAIENTARGVGIVKSAVTGGDLSNPLRQTLVLTAHEAFHQPVKTAQNIKEMILSYSRRRYEKFDKQLKSDPSWDKAKAAGVNLIDTPSNHEAFLGVDLIDRAIKNSLAKPWKDPRKWLAEVAEKWTVGAARAYTHYQNQAMLDAFKIGERLLQKHNTLNPQGLKDIAHIINVFGSRTPISSGAKAWNVAFFSPQMIKSRALALYHTAIDSQLLTAKEGKVKFAPVLGWRTLETPATRGWARKMTAETIGFGGALLGLGYVTALAMGKNPQIELDSRSNSFAKLRVGHTTLNPWGGYQEYLRATVQLATGQEKLRGSGRVQKARRGEILSRLLRSKLSPAAGLATSLVTGSTFEGKEARSASGVGRAVANTVTPLVGQDVFDILKDSPDVMAPLFILASVFGAGVQAGPGARGSWIETSEQSVQDVRVSDEIARLKLEPPRIGNKVTLPGRNIIGQRRYYSLTGEEQEKFRDEVMPLVSRELDTVIKSDRYKRLSDDQKRMLLYRAIKIENARYSANARLKKLYADKPAKNLWWGEEEK